MLKLFGQAITALTLGLFINNAVFAQSPPIPITPRELPATAQPQVISNVIQEQTQKQVPSNAPAVVSQPKQAPSTLGPQAEQIKFKLTKVVLDGNYAFTTEELSALYKDKVGTNISVAELMDIVQSITNYYRNNGYILSRAVLPPQHVEKGEVHIRVIEGFIDEIKIIGTPKGARPVIKAYMGKVTHSRPLQVKVLEYYLRLTNNLPGVHVKSVLEPSKTTLAAATLNVVSDTNTLAGYLSYDNYGSLYSGPNEGTVNMSANSIFRSGDVIQLTYVTTARPKELKYRDISYATPIGPTGLKFIYDANQSNTRPGLNLRPLKINGLSNAYSGTFSYPLILSRDTDLTVSAAFTYTDSGTTAFGERLYMDHLRTLRVSADFNHADIYKGNNTGNLSVENGMRAFGATTDQTSLTTSRFGGTGAFTKFNISLSRTQQLSNRFSALILGKGQYSCQPLLSGEQFTFGGSQLGRGYDSADIIGDLGVAGSLELRMDFVPQLRFLQYLQPYVFYDAGMIWDRKNILGSKSKQSESSTGFGVRLLLTQHLSGNLMVGQPLTKQDTTEEVVGNGRKPRGFFSITLSS